MQVRILFILNLIPSQVKRKMFCCDMLLTSLSQECNRYDDGGTAVSPLPCLSLRVALPHR